MYDQIKQVVLASGLWDNGRAASHGFILSPSVYEISQEKRNELKVICEALHDCLAGLGRIAAIAYNPQLGHSATWGMIARALRTGVPAIYHDIMLFKPGRVPSICKVDLMVSEDGSYRIAEIDGHNKHGLGYSTLAARIRKAIAPQVWSFPGVAAALAKEIKKRGESSAMLLYSDKERFYLPEFRILQDELTAHKINLFVIAQNEMKVENGKIVVLEKNKEHRLFIDLPFLYYNRTLNNLLADLYRNGKIDFLIPPKPFFGSKAILALLRNDTGNKELEAILRSQIRSASLELLRQHIPESYLIHKRAKQEYWQNLCNDRQFVLKESISSGTKGIVFADNPRFATILKRACNSYYHFVLQKEVTNRLQHFQYFTDDGELRQDEWYMRLTLHCSMRDVADIVITARRDKKVHGALDCLQLGATIV
ncbi:hypothetical protein MYX07_02785 [Patescibacteria group bacterium AH-259-L07]|nr:hypothetical protein [Patescibacteria group bacterium AH-259-L07]